MLSTATQAFKRDGALTEAIDGTRAEPMARMGFLPRFMRPPHPVPQRHAKLIGLVGIASLLGAYDLNIFGLAAKQVLGEFGLNENMTGPTIAIFRLGVFGALILCLLADVFGRRRMLLITIIGMAISTVSTAFAPNYETFVAAQFMVRMFAFTEDMLCIVVIAEEFEERTRGWAVGSLGALSAIGAGLAVLVFALVNLLPFGWRAIYVLGAIPLFLLAWMRRGLPETQRFRQLSVNAPKRSALSAWRPLVQLAKAYPGRLTVVMLAAGLFAFGVAAALGLMPTYIQTYHGFTPRMVTLTILTTGLAGLIVNILAGRISDIVGRKVVLTICLISAFAGFMLLYSGDTVLLVVIGIFFGVFGQMAAAVQFEALGTELFPTEYRATASAMRFIAGIMAGAAGLLLHGTVLSPGYGFGTAVLILLAPVPLTLIGIWLLPETAGRSLEDISGPHKT